MSGPAQSNVPTVLALLALLAVGIGLLGLTALVMPQAFGFLAVIVGFFAFGAINYLIWGWWLQPLPVEDESQAEIPRIDAD
ncbi:MAG TPA: hypothetical protein VGP63_27845 [Planctomycetaceae bacterium]|jgi:hypothetical protein|nr:hypothetical protein [Planctomycetaceae bacterium]